MFIYGIHFVLPSYRQLIVLVFGLAMTYLGGRRIATAFSIMRCLLTDVQYTGLERGHIGKGLVVVCTL